MHALLAMGLRLREAREEAGLSLRAVAVKAGVDFSTIYRIGTGDTIPKFDALEKLAKALGIPVRDLIENGK
jgi:transcriptional regulator with XRE-family HTH domain